MKRIISLVLVISMVLIMAFSLTGCKKNDANTPTYANGESTTSSSSADIDLSLFDGKKLQPYLQMICDGKYYIQMKGTLESGEEAILTYTKIDGDEKVSINGQYSYAYYQDESYFINETTCEYLKITDDIKANTEYASDLEDMQVVLLYCRSIALNLIFLMPSDETINVTFKDSVSHEEYIDRESGTGYIFFFDSSDGLIGYAAVDSSTNNPTVSDFVMGKPQDSDISSIFSMYTDAAASTQS